MGTRLHDLSANICVGLHLHPILTGASEAIVWLLRRLRRRVITKYCHVPLSFLLYVLMVLIQRYNPVMVQAVRSAYRPISSFNDLLRYNITTGDRRWTGIRRITVLKWSGSVDSDTLFDCLAVNIASMSLVQVSCDTELPSLCENGSISTTSVNEGIGFDGSINEGQTVKFNALAVGLVFGGVLLGTLIAMGVVLVKRRKQTKMRKTSATFHNSNYETAMDATIPAEYAEVNYDVTSPGNARTDDTYDHARIQSLGRVLVDRREVFGPSSVQGLDDDYDHIH
uniref:Uncharacterized protein LOC111121367 isoform X2 n=1 Tax=Crassostrea virginica TaxID=6565 RepID=A0A8B8CR78_CRAVI|nr:uncharacterized protein LOC111121367 isoform X2 [Crassostrea virginica]